MRCLNNCQVEWGVMNLCTIFRSRKYGPIQKIILLLALVGTGVLVFWQVTWVYQNIQSDMGSKMAETSLADHIVILLALTAVGFALGYQVDWSIRHQTSIFHSLHEGSWAEMLIHLWGYDLKFGAESTIQADLEAQLIPKLDSFELIDRPRRRGRKPTFPLERWLPIAVQWENRDPIRDAFTLGELISEHLGTNSDGSPVVSEQTYYSTWRERALQELQRRAQSRKSSGVSKPQPENNP